jgi:hypothetical protein
LIERRKASFSIEEVAEQSEAGGGAPSVMTVVPHEAHSFRPEGAPPPPLRGASSIEEEAD